LRPQHHAVAGQPLRGFLRMKALLNAISSLPHAEERPTGASRSTHDAFTA
jgi:hypothetical protein